MSDERIIVGLDIGTTKICTVIGEVARDGVLDIIGEGTVPSDGLRKGVVVNLERTIASVRQSVADAQRMAGVEVTSAWVGVAGSHLKALTSHGMAAIRRGQQVTKSDIDRTIEALAAFFHSLGMPTTLTAYGLDPDKVAEEVQAHLEAGGFTRGEHRDVTPADAAAILRLSR